MSTSTPTASDLGDDVQPRDGQSSEAADSVDFPPEDEATQEDLLAADGGSERRFRWWTKVSWSRIVAFGVLPAFALLLTGVAAFAKWSDTKSHQDTAAGAAALQAATHATVALLSYKSDTVADDLDAARSLLTGDFRDSYTALIHDTVIPGAQQMKISSTATVSAAALISASQTRSVAMLFVDQAVTVGTDPSTTTTSAVRVTLDKVGDQWLVSQFEPI